MVTGFSTIVLELILHDFKTPEIFFSFSHKHILTISLLDETAFLFHLLFKANKMKIEIYATTKSICRSTFCEK